MNQWKIVWLPVWIKFDILLEIVLYLVRVYSDWSWCVIYQWNISANLHKNIFSKILLSIDRILKKPVHKILKETILLRPKTV